MPAILCSRRFRRSVSGRAALPLPSATGAAHLDGVLSLLLFAPFFLVFEVWQLVQSERYLGVKQIARGADPRSLGLGELTAFCWSALLIGYWIWMLLLLAVPMGRVAAANLVFVSMIGFSLRRGARFKWVLVILTFEGAIRIGLLLYLCLVAWRRVL